MTRTTLSAPIRATTTIITRWGKDKGMIIIAKMGCFSCLFLIISSSFFSPPLSSPVVSPPVGHGLYHSEQKKGSSQASARTQIAGIVTYTARSTAKLWEGVKWERKSKEEKEREENWVRGRKWAKDRCFTEGLSLFLDSSHKERKRPEGLRANSIQRIQKDNRTTPLNNLPCLIVIIIGQASPKSSLGSRHITKELPCGLWLLCFFVCFVLHLTMKECLFFKNVTFF